MRHGFLTISGLMVLLAGLVLAFRAASGAPSPRESRVGIPNAKGTYFGLLQRSDWRSAAR